MKFGCMMSLLLAGAQRLALVLLWVFWPARVELAFDSVLMPVLGLIFLPILTFTYVLIAPEGVQGLDWLWLGLALAGDLVIWGGGFYLNRMMKD